MQTSIPVRPGSSGGPVIDPFGNVIGVIFQQEQGHWGTALFADDVIKLIEGEEE